MSIFRMVVLCLVVMIQVLTGFGCSLSNPIDQVVMCSSVTQSAMPGLAATSFPPDVKTIYCSVKLNSIDAGKVVKADWYVVKSEETSLTDTLIGSESLNASSQYIVFSLVRSDSLLPGGEYAVKVYYNGELAQTTGFKVEGQPSPSALKLSDISISTNIDQISGRALDVMEIVPNDTPELYCTAKVEDAEFNDSVASEWIYVKGELAGFEGKKIASLTQKVEDRKYLNFSLLPAKGKFPAGEYRVNLLVGGIIRTGIPFKVMEASEIQGPLLSQAVIYKVNVSGDNQTAEITSIFPQDIDTIYGGIKVYNAPAGTQIKLAWYYDNDETGALYDSLLKEDKDVIQGTSHPFAALSIAKNKSAADKFLVGDYSIRVFLNDIEKMRIPFRVKSS